MKARTGDPDEWILDQIHDAKILDEARKERPDDDDDDWDDDDEEAPEDPEKDKVPHILMQLRKAKDVDGNHPIKFADGSKSKLPLKDIDAFMDMYMMVKPLDREKMQQVAIMSKENFDKIVSFFKPKHGRAEKSIYDRR
jgi:predicted DNA-binding transcriptional regulator YafY